MGIVGNACVHGRELEPGVAQMAMALAPSGKNRELEVVGGNDRWNQCWSCYAEQDR